MEENRQRLLAERQALKEQHLKNVEQLKEQWKQHNFEKEQMLRNAPAPSQEKPDIAQEAELKRSSIAHRTDFDSARQPQASEQDNNQIKTGEDLANQKSLSSEYAETQRRHAEEAQKQSEQNRCQNKDDRNH